MRSELLGLEGMLVIVLTHALAHRGKLTHLISGRHASLLLRLVH